MFVTALYLQSCNCPVVRVQKQLSKWRQLWRTIPSVTAMHEGSGTFIDKPGNCYSSLRHKYEIQPQWIYQHEAVLVKCRLQFTGGGGGGEGGWIDYNQLSLFKGGHLWDRYYVIVSVLERRPSY